MSIVTSPPESPNDTGRPATEPAGARALQDSQSAARPLQYNSALMLDRRQRLLRETRRMIGEDGPDSFSIRKLCERAGVSQGTLYNAFKGRDRLIATALAESFETFNAFCRYRTDPNTIDGILDRGIVISRQNLKLPNYAKAICHVYFGKDTEAEVWQMLQDMSIRPFSECLATLRARGELQAWVDDDDVCNAMANIQYSVMNDWCHARTSDEAYPLRLVECMLMIVTSAVDGRALEGAKAHLARIKRTGALPVFPKPVWAPKVASDAA